MLLLQFYYAYVILPLKLNCNIILFLILLYLYSSTDDYLTKEKLIEAIIFCNKRKRNKKLPQGVLIRKWLISVQETGYVMGHIGSNTATTSRVKSRSGLKEKLDIIDMKANPNRAVIDEILADIPNSERNRNPTASQYSITCP